MKHVGTTVRGSVRTPCVKPVRLGLAASVLSCVAFASMAAVAATSAQAQGAPQPTTLTSTLSGAGQTGSSITVPAGTTVTDKFTLTGTNVGTTGGEDIDVDIWSGPGCSTHVTGGLTNIFPAGTASFSFTTAATGTYNWTATYPGDADNTASFSACGAEVETVRPAEPSGAPPGPPSCATTATGGTGENTVNWCGPTNPGTAAVQCYQIYRSAAGGPAGQIANVCSGQPGFSSMSYTDTSATCNTTYTYYVTSSNVYGASPPSNTASASATCGTPAPPPGSCSSYTGNSAFICALYVDLLGRVPAASEINGWLNQLNSGVSRTLVAALIIFSPEHETDVLNSFYEDCLGRPIDQSGLSTWLPLLESGLPLQVVEAAILSSPEFYADSGSTNAGWVNGVYQCLLGRMADPSGLSTWTTALANGVSPSQVALAIANSGEAYLDDIEGDYELLLNRPADSTGLIQWGSALASGVSPQEVLAAIAGSQEFYTDAPAA